MTCFQNRGSYRINKVSRVFISHPTGLSSEFINVAIYSHPNFSFFSKKLKDMLRVWWEGLGEERKARLSESNVLSSLLLLLKINFFKHQQA